MQKVNLAISLFILSISFPNSLLATALFQSSISDKVKTPESKNKKNVNAIPKAEAPKINLDNIGSENSEDAIRSTLKKYDLILSREKKIENIISIEFNKVVCFIKLAKIIRIKSGGKKVTSEEDIYLKKSLQGIEHLLNERKLSKEMVSQLYFFQGNSYLDLSLKEKSRDSFEKSISTYEGASFVPSLSLYLADLYYDDGDLNKAINGYKRFYSRMTPGEKDLSVYKIAWIFLNQSQIDKSIDLFLNLISISKSQSIVQDSILSLSVALGEKYNQDFILNKLKDSKISNENRLKILIGTYENILRRPNLPRLKILEEILHSETKEDEVLKLITAEIEYMEVSDKLPLEIIEFQSIKKYLFANKKKIAIIESASLLALGQGLERIISKSLESYQKDKNNNSYIMLRLSIDCYLKLNIFKRQVEVAGLLLELLKERNEEASLFALCKEILNDSQYISLRDKAKLIFLLGLENKYLADPKNQQEKFFSLLRKYLSNTKAEQWESVTLKFYDYLVKANINAEAEIVMENLYKIYPREEYLLKSVAIKFEQKKCSEVLQLIENQKKLDERFLEYKRECSLIIAQDSKKSTGTYSTYKKNIIEFINLSEGSKKKSAIADYLVSLENKDQNDEKSKLELKNLMDNSFYAYRFEPELFPIYQRSILSLMERGRFKEAYYYLKDCALSKICIPFKELEVQLEHLLLADQSSEIKIEIFNNLSSDIYGYLSLVKPEFLLSNFIRQRNNEVKINPLFLLIAARLSAIDWKDEQFITVYNKVEELLSKDEKILTFSSLWKMLSKVNIPESSGRNKLKDKDILFFMTKVQNTRKVILAELATFSIESQKLVLEKAIDLELKMATAIKSSPIPRGLESAKISDYEKGLKDLAEEFVVQAESYKKLIININEQLLTNKNQAVNNFDDLIAPINVDKWEFGKQTFYNEKIKEFIYKNNSVQALFYLDYLLSISTIKSDEYYLNRSAVLLISSSNRNKTNPMIKYVANECESNQQLSLLKNWKERSLKK